MIKVTNIGTPARSNWILETSAGIIAVDTGFPGQCDVFLKRFCRRWRLEDLKYIFLTHAHSDHCGFLGEILDKTNASAVVGEKSLPILISGSFNEPHEYLNWFGKILEAAVKLSAGRFPPVSDDERLVVVSQGSPFFRDLGLAIEVLDLPGHTADSVGLRLVEDEKIFCGDAAMNVPLINANRHCSLIESVKDFGDSWDKMTALGAKLIYPGHGGAFKAEDLGKYRHYLDR